MSSAGKRDTLINLLASSRILADVKIDSLATARAAAEKLHTLGVSNIIITTLKVPERDVPRSILLPNADDQSLYCLSSQKTANGLEQHLIAFPTYEGYFSGTGDMFSALVVARWQEELKKPAPSLATATKRVVSSVNAVTKRTWEHQVKHLKKLTNGEVDHLEGRPSSPALIRCCELQMVQSKRVIEDPELAGESAIKMTRLS